ncbi:MAG: hypothetical protein GX874_10335 [Smithella sp.]|nr:hypothetical protein [Smithella sp.]
MTFNLTPADHQAIADLENVMLILLFEREKDKSSFSAETIAYIESVLDKFGPVFEEQKGDQLAFAQTAKSFLSALLAHQPFREFVDISDDAYVENQTRYLSPKETEIIRQATEQAINQILNHFELLTQQIDLDQKADIGKQKNV